MRRLRDALHVQKLTGSEVDPSEHDQCKLVCVGFDEFLDVLGAQQILARSGGAQQQCVIGIDAACVQVGLDRIGVGWKCTILDQDPVSSSIGSVETDHEKMEVHGEGVHHDDLARSCAHQSSARFPESFVVVEPGPRRFEVPLDSEASPVVEFFLHACANTRGHQSQGVAAEIDHRSAVFAQRDLELGSPTCKRIDRIEVTCVVSIR
eukprot:gene252-gene559